MTKTALVTGHRGFIGRHMVERLLAHGYRVRGVDIEWSPTGPNSPDFYYGDLRETLSAEWHAARPGGDIDLLVHCAYHVGGRAAIDSDVTALTRNILLDSTVFDYARESGTVGRVLYFSSSAVYPTFYQERGVTFDLRESLYAPTSTADADYGYAKVVGERMAARLSDAVPVTVVRPFSGYGGDQSTDYPFPSLLQKCRDSNAIEVWGSAGQIRDWIHVDDVVAGSVYLAEKGVSGPVNLGTGRGVSIADLVHAMCAVLGRTWDYEIEVRPDAPMGVFRRVADTTLMTQLGFTPTISLEEGIRLAVRS